eukprot:3531146-Rhodomonas_salina.2
MQFRATSVSRMHVCSLRVISSTRLTIRLELRDEDDVAAEASEGAGAGTATGTSAGPDAAMTLGETSLVPDLQCVVLVRVRSEPPSSHSCQIYNV